MLRPGMMLITDNVQYFKTAEEAILAFNPQFRKKPQPEIVTKYVNAAKTLGKKCGVNIKGETPQDIVKFSKKVQYAKQNKNSIALKNLLDMFSKYTSKGQAGEILLKLRLPKEGKQILEGIKLKGFKP